MKSYSKRNGAVCIRKICRAFGIACEIPVCIGKCQIVAVNRFAEVRLAVDFVAEVLHDGKLCLHEGGVVAVASVAHHSGGLKMRAFK